MPTNWSALTAGGKPYLTVSPGATSSSGADYGSDTSLTQTNGIYEALVQANSNAVGTTSGPARVFLLPGTFAIKSPVTINFASNASVELVGSGKASILQPQSNVDVIQLTAPSGSGNSLRKIRLADFQILDNLSGFQQTSTGGIFLNPSNNQINELIIERVSMYNTYYGIYSEDLSSNQAASIQTAAFSRIRINNYRYVGFQLFNFFDSVLDDIYCQQAGGVSTVLDGFQLYNSGFTSQGPASGSFGVNLKALGQSGSTKYGTGFSVSKMRDLQLMNCHADSYWLGYSTNNQCDRVHYYSVGSINNSGDGCYVNHSSGWVFFFAVVCEGNAGWGVKNYGQTNGNMAIFNSAMSSNTSGSIHTATGDVTYNTLGST